MDQGITRVVIIIVSGTAEAGTETNAIVWLLTSFNHQVPKTTLSLPADSQDNYAMSPHSAHCQYDRSAQILRTGDQRLALAKQVRIHGVYISKRSTDRESRWAARVHGTVS